ncbi:MAG: hypothetical protein COA58_08100 [Bacteroidetes bacterium]|nr:MAG: hypothetical protein COA58_08100 [Bacteroidota bacterium]
MKSFDINNHFSELDRSILEGENAYSDYFNNLKFGLNSLLSSLNHFTADTSMEMEIVKSYCQKFLNTIEVFRLKYSFDDNNQMLVDLTESGFPNFLEFKKLTNDMNTKNAKLDKLPSVESIKQNILDSLIKNKRHPTKLLKQLSSVCYLSKLSKSKLFFEFTPGKLELIREISSSNNQRRYLYSWGSYDSVTNRPYIYILVFDNTLITRKTNSDVKKDYNFIDAIKRLTHNSAPLKVMASDIDEAFEAIHPKVLKRIDIGPIFGQYAQDEHFFTTMLRKNFGKEDFVFTYNTEIIFSVGEKRNSSFLSTGDLRQIFHVDESNKDCMDRMISKMHKYLITSHSVLQYITEHNPEIIKDLSTPPHVYSN